MAEMPTKTFVTEDIENLAATILGKLDAIPEDIGPVLMSVSLFHAASTVMLKELKTRNGPSITEARREQMRDQGVLHAMSFAAMKAAQAEMDRLAIETNPERN